MRFVTVLAAALAAGCYSPHPHGGAPCANGACPDGLVCSPATNTCEVTAIDAAHEPIDSPLRDAPPTDGTPIDGPLPGPMLVQQKSGQASGAVLVLTLPASPKAGDVLLVIGGNPAGALTSVSGGGATWTRIDYSTAESNIEVWGGITDGSSATVTVSLVGSSSPTTGWIGEWSGLDTTTIVDGHIVASGQVQSIDAGSLTTTHAHDVLVFATSVFTMDTLGTPAPGQWTKLDGVTAGVSQGEWYRIVPATGTFHPTLDHTTGGWDAALVALRAAN